MGFTVKIYDEFTVNENVNRAILGLSIIRLFLFFCIFLLNLNQTIQEIFLARSKNKSLINNARFFTYLSITIYPFTRLFMIGVFLGVDKNIDNGSYTVGVSIWGTLFQYFEWSFIGAWWARVLYTFFIMKEVVLHNKRRVWQGIWVIVSVLITWTIIQTIFNFYFLDLMNASYGAGQVVIVCGIGGYYLANGVLLYRAIRVSGQNPQLEKSFKTIKKLALALVIMVVSVFIIFIIQVPIMGLKEYDTDNYIFYLFQCLLEYTQLSVVMYSLGGNSFTNYFSIQRIKDIKTGSGKTHSNNNFNVSSNLNNNSGSMTQSPSIHEINLDDIENSNNNKSQSSLTHKTSSTNLNNSNTNININISIDSNLNSSSANLIV